MLTLTLQPSAPMSSYSAAPSSSSANPTTTQPADAARARAVVRRVDAQPNNEPLDVKAAARTEENFAMGTRGYGALMHEAAFFSLAVDHHHWAFNALLSSVFCLTHCLFIAGQMLDLWEAAVVVNISDVAVDCAGIVNISVPNITAKHVLLADSYASIVQTMWVENDMRDGNPDVNVDFNTRTSAHLFAVLLVIFSGCWPHVKLVACHWLWYARYDATQRTRALVWLEFFGKWSMLDVLSIVLVCTVFAVDFNGSLEKYVYNVMDGAETFLNSMACPANFSHVLCHGLVPWPVDGSPAPSPAPGPSCHNLVEPYLDGTSGLTIPELMQIANYTCQADSGGAFRGSVDVVLGAYTEEGIYFFSTAVWISLLLSAFTNLRNESILIRLHGENREKFRALRTSGEMMSAAGDDDDDADGYQQPLLEVGLQGGGAGSSSKDDTDDASDVSQLCQPNNDRAVDVRRGESALVDESHRHHHIKGPGMKCKTLFGHAGMSARWSVAVVAVVVVAAACEYVMLFVPCMERKIVGSAGYLIDLINNGTGSEDLAFTMWDNALMILHGSGDNPFLQKDLVIFLMVGPTACLFFTLVNALLPMSAGSHYVVAKLAGLGFTFSGVEVLAAACLLCCVILPVQSAGVLEGFGYNWCSAAQHMYVPRVVAQDRMSLTPLRPHRAPTHLTLTLLFLPMRTPASYGVGALPCFYESVSVTLPAFLALPLLFVLSSTLAVVAHKAVSKVFPMNVKVSASR